MTSRKPRYTGRFGHVNSWQTINILVLYLKIYSNTDFTDETDYLMAHRDFNSTTDCTDFMLLCSNNSLIRDFATPHSAPLGQRIRS